MRFAPTNARWFPLGEKHWHGGTDKTAIMSAFVSRVLETLAVGLKLAGR